MNTGGSAFMDEKPSSAAQPEDEWRAWLVELRPPASEEALALAAEIENELFEAPQIATCAPSPTLRGGANSRLAALTDAIAANPDAAVNYVMRGELFLEHGERELAYADFVKALTLAAAQLETEEWGLVAQAVQDRAEAGLRRLIRS
jgi:hypothetical protein